MQLGTNLIIGSSKTLRPAAHSEALIDFGGTARQGYSCSGERRHKLPIFNHLQVKTGGCPWHRVDVVEGKQPLLLSHVERRFLRDLQI